MIITLFIGKEGALHGNKSLCKDMLMKNTLHDCSFVDLSTWNPCQLPNLLSWHALFSKDLVHPERERPWRRWRARNPKTSSEARVAKKKSLVSCSVVGVTVQGVAPVALTSLAGYVPAARSTSRARRCSCGGMPCLIVSFQELQCWPGDAVVVGSGVRQENNLVVC